MNTINDASQQLQPRYINSRFSSSVDDWPPYQPEHYTTLAFIHGKGHTDTVRFSIAQELAVFGKINQSEIPKHLDLNVSMTKKISDIFSPIVLSDGSSVTVDLHVLIEGAPGIGKTVLAKEIAYQWAKKKLLTSKKLLLLVLLRECHQTQLKSVEELVQFIFKSSKMVSCLTNHLLQTEGSDTVIVFDGFDELSAENRNKSIMVDIINRRILTKCCLVVTSRPTASLSLRSTVNRWVEIVGFTEEDRLDYIQTALKNCDEKVKGLQDYLHSNPTINALCYIPFNMTILLCLAEDGINTLPKTQTEMYKKFIEMTIVRFVKKYEGCAAVRKIADLPYTFNKVYVELAKLAYKALETDEIVFTLSEIEEGCRNLTINSDNWNGLGLLKAVHYFSPQMGRDQVTFHFLHFSIQEYIAAWYISTLSNNEQIKLLKETFWKHRYYNTWIMYVGITSGSSFALKHFLSGNRFQIVSKLFKVSKVTKKYLKHKIRCLHLFQCLLETGKEDDIKSVKLLFQNNQIDLSNQTLLPSDLDTLGFFLIRSVNKEWDELDLSNCNIGINGSNILCDRLLDKDVCCTVTIKKVNFSNNQLNCSSVIRLFSLFKSWHTSEIFITDDAILDCTTDIEEIENIVAQSSTLILVFIGCYLFSKSLQLNKILSNTTNIKSIYFLNCNWESGHSRFLEFLENQKLGKVRIIGSSLNTTVIQVMASMLLCNNKFVNMLVYDPTMSDEVGDFISSCILGQSKDISGLMLIVTNSKIQGFINTCTLSNELSALELYNLVRYLKTKTCLWRQDMENYNKNITINAFVDMLLSNNWQLELSLMESDSLIIHKKIENTGIFLLSILLQNVRTLKKLSISSSSISNETADEIAVVISYNMSLQELSLCRNNLQALGIMNILRSLQQISSLTKLCICNNSIVNEAIDDIAADGIAVVISHNRDLQEVYLSSNDLQTLGVIKIAKSLQKILSLTKLYIDHNSITDEAADDIAAAISCNRKLQEFDISGNNLRLAGVLKVMEALKYVSTLRKPHVRNKNITDGVADDIEAVIPCNTDMNLLDISGNNFQATGAIKIEKLLQNILMPKMLFISYNAEVDRTAVTSCNACLQEVYICRNDFHSTGVNIFTKPLQNIFTLSKLHIGYNDISDEAADDIATIISANTKLNEIEISENRIQTTGAIKMMKGLLKINSFRKIYLNSYHITGEAADDIAIVLSYNNNLQELNLSCNNLQMSGCIKIAKSLCKISSLTKLYIDRNNITYDAADDIAAAISCNTNLQELNLGGNNLQTSGTIKIAKSLQEMSSLTTLVIDNNNITDEAADDIAAVISCNINLQELNLGSNNLQTLGTIKIAKSLQEISSLTTLVIDNNNITDDAADDIAAVISCNINLQELNLGSNSLQTLGIITIARSLQTISSLITLCIDHNNITYDAADDIAAAISCNTNLQELNLGSNDLQTLGTTTIARSLQTISSLIALHIDHNNITYDAADDIATAISFNAKLQVFDISGNNLEPPAAEKIMKALKGIATLRKVNINNNNITKEVADDIAAAISCNTNLQELNLGGNNLQTLGTIKIVKTLQKMSSLTKLYIDSNNITSGAADDIAIAIFYNTNLQELNLGGNNLRTLGTKKIIKTLQKMSSLTKLYIDGSNITSGAADDIAVAISCNTNLQELNLGGNNLQTSGSIKIAKSLHKISSLTKLCIDRNNITYDAADDIAVAISCNINLQELNLGGNNLQTLGTIKIVKTLQKMSSLTKLYIDSNNITSGAADDIAVAIFYNTNLQELNLGGNNLQTSGTIKIAKSLQEMSSLTKLVINNNNITSEAADDIAAAISCNTNLQELNLGSNNLGTLGTATIARSLQTISSLITLCIDYNNITYDAADDIAAAISCNTNLQELNLGSNNLQTLGTTTIARSLQTISFLIALRIDHNNITYDAADDIAAAISCNAKLQVFDISGNNLEPPAAKKIMKALKGIATLRKLNISNSNITEEVADDIAAAISCNTNLQELNLGGNNLQTLGTIKIVKTLQKMSSLAKLYIDNNNITSGAADDIAVAISYNTNLQELNLGGNNLQTLGTIKIVKTLQKISSLTKLYIDNNSITSGAADDIAVAISCNIHLQELNLGGNDLHTSGAIKIAQSLRIKPSLTKLCINNNYITSGAADDIAVAISCNTNLQELNLGGNNLQTSGAIKIAKSLQKISSLTKLYIDNNHITVEAAYDIAAAISCSTNLLELNLGGNNLETLGTIAIARSLQTISSLITLCIDHNNITYDAADDIAAAISCNAKLQVIDISGNNLEPACAEKIMKALESITTLRKLNISNNNITDKAAEDIAAAISSNINLQELNLGSNDLQTLGATTIARSLQTISSLIALHIDHNNITYDAADDIAAAISCNDKLQVFDISGNNLESVAAEKIMKALKGICTLRKLNISNNNITDEVAGDIATIISCNACMKVLDISRNNFQQAGAMIIIKALKGISMIRKLCIGSNSITEKLIADVVTIILSFNTDMEVFDISGNNFQAMSSVKIEYFLQNIYAPEVLFITNITEVNGFYEVYICRNDIQAADAKAIINGLQDICTLSLLHFSCSNISDEAANNIAIIISFNTKLKVIEISGNEVQTSGVIQIMKSLQLIHTIENLHLDNNNITEEVANDIATVISSNEGLQKLNLGGNNFQTSGTIAIVKSLQTISSLIILCLDHNNITYEAADDIALAITCNVNLQELDLSVNDFQTFGTIKIAKSLQNISSLTKLCIYHNNITDKAADDIAAAILCNIKLQELNLGGNNLQTSGTIKIAKGLQKISSLMKLCISYNNITDEAADDILMAISSNTKLQEFDISGNYLHLVVGIKILKALESIGTPRKHVLIY